MEKELKKKIEECEKQKNEYLAGWQRAKADFLNYKKEEVERFKKILEYTNEDFILEILPVLDNFEKAEKEISKSEENNDYLKGLLHIKLQLKNIMKSRGIKELISIDQKFDPSIHDAVEIIEDKNKNTGEIIEEVQKGYKLNGKVIRPAKVKVIK